MRLTKCCSAVRVQVHSERHATSAGPELTSHALIVVTRQLVVILVAGFAQPRSQASIRR
jgi:hypothetical protein